ncbi:restriction endonuclease [Marinomonas sp. TI.3.20]|uniref:restriction endonuclease n=1 Tax=Marinomonas sp. TI.3.20 TaxID=3121296 RepID=UPI00311E0CAB
MLYNPTIEPLQVFSNSFLVPVAAFFVIALALLVCLHLFLKKISESKIRPKSNKQKWRLKAARKKHKGILKASPSDRNNKLENALNEMDGFEFELYAMELLRINLKPNYISSPKLTADYGLDGVMVEGKHVLLLQSKHYMRSQLSAKAITDLADIRDRVIARKRKNKFHKMIGIPRHLLANAQHIVPVVITTGAISSRVYDLAKSRDVIIISKKHLLTDLRRKFISELPSWQQ